MLTLRGLVDNPALELRVLAEGAPGALDSEVLWVHNTELPDPSPYLRNRELVLTNGLWRTDAAMSATFVANVVRAGAAGIVFGLRDSTPRTPEDLVDACRGAQLPLAEISTEVPFTALTQAAADMYADERQSAILGAVRRGNALAETISRGFGASGVLGILRRDHELPLAVVDRSGRLLAAADFHLDAAALDMVVEALNRHPPPLELDLGPSGPATVFLVGALTDVDAALLCLRPASALRGRVGQALEQAATFLSLELAKQQAVQAIEMRFAGELIDMILSGGSRAAAVAERLHAFGIDAGGPLAVCALAFSGGGAAAPPTLAETVGEFFVGEGVPAVVITGSDDVIAVLSWRGPGRELPAFAHTLVAAVEDRHAQLRPVIGIGDVVPDASGLRRPLVESRDACRLLRQRSGGPQVGSLSELGTHRILLGLQDPEVVRRFAEGVLGPLRTYDDRRGAGLEATLRSFLAHDCQWAATAAALFIHVNTLRNRLTKITELTGKDVNHTADRVDLFLALESDAAITHR
ncbi:PucR family transcriptional regulator ligand-binding domain-containing protein [Actinopolymorpha sp. B17G11]|uniref:PucR family transcriptional regulator n=1 Tax=unclassified Actinopolymorpha TaxID=2627063 RepID=UPI0032D9A242